MNNILVITSKCFKNRRADGICGRYLEECLKKHNENTYLLGYSNEDVDNYRIEITQNEYEIIYKKNKNSKNKIKRLFRPNIDQKLCSILYKVACEIIEDRKINVVIGVYFPLEVLVVLCELKKKYGSITTIDYEVDSSIDNLTNTSRLSTFYNYSEKKYLLKLYEYFDYFFVMKSHYERFKKNVKKEIIDKTEIIDVPILIHRKYEKQRDNKEHINFVYAGTLNYEYYSPEPIIKFFNINNINNWKLHFYSKGDCEEYIGNESTKDSRIIRHGYVDTKELENAMNNADFFFNIEHKLKPSSIPSKTFEYFSYGKPIIHFYNDSIAFSKEYIEKYPLSISVKSSDVEKENSKILDFISKNIGKITDYEFVSKIFYMNNPEYSVEKILSVIKK